MNRKFLKLLSLMLVLVIFTLTFAGCGKKKGDKVDIGYISGNYQMIIDSVDEINCDYLLVYRASAGFGDIDAFVDFMERLSASSSYTFQICPDTLNVTDAKQKIILLGNTSYAESDKTIEIMEAIRSDNYYDYLLRGYENTLSINWVSKFGRDDAFNYVLNSLLNNGFGKTFNEDFSYLYLSDRRDTPVVTIDDINIIQYSVVVPTAATYIEYSAAEKLVRAIKDATGEEIPLVTDAAEESRYEILIGETNRGETYVTSFFATKRYSIAQYSTKLILRGGQVEATTKAVTDFTTSVRNAAITAEPLHIRSNYVKTGSITTLGGDYFDGYSLVYCDEFNADSLDTKQWTLENGAITSFGDFGYLMNFSSKAVKTDGKNAIIKTYLSDDGYVSGHMTTEKAFSFKYGYIETRIRTRCANGVWLKMLLTNQNDSGDKISQIDVFNLYGRGDSVFASAGTLEKKTYYSNYLKLMEPSFETYRSGAFLNGEPANPDEYHTYGVEWTEDYVRFFLDGVSYGTVELTADKYKDLRTEMYIDFIGGVNLTELTANDEECNWPINLDVDWVRVYQKPDGVRTDRIEAAAKAEAEANKKAEAKK